MTPWITTQQQATTFWMNAWKNSASISMDMMRNFNKLVTASMPMMSKAFEIGADNLGEMQQQAKARVVDPLENVPVTLATLPHHSPTPLTQPSDRPVKPPFSQS